MATAALCAALPALADPVAVDAAAVPLDPDKPERETLGTLAYAGGVSLLSPDRRFGGWSGLVVSPDGSRLTAVSDVGWSMTATIARLDGRIVGLMEADIAPLLGPDGKPVAGNKEMGDAEALALLPDGGMAVAFEQHHRIWVYPPAADGRSPLLGIPTEIPVPPELMKAENNGGLEALATRPDGSFIGFAEELPDANKRHTGWVFGGPAAPAPRTLKLEANGIFKPTDMKMLPSGDFLLLQRRYTVSGGPGARLSVISAAAIDDGKPIRDQELAVIPARMTVDNFEGLGLWQDGEGRTRAIILSDDNYSVLQRTLMMEFVLPR